MSIPFVYFLKIYDIQVVRLGNIVIIDIVGNGFLYNMVRIIVGPEGLFLVDVMYE